MSPDRRLSVLPSGMISVRASGNRAGGKAGDFVLHLGFAVDFVGLSVGAC